MTWDCLNPHEPREARMPERSLGHASRDLGGDGTGSCEMIRRWILPPNLILGDVVHGVYSTLQHILNACA
jgi:hypothetical protein